MVRPFSPSLLLSFSLPLFYLALILHPSASLSLPLRPSSPIVTPFRSSPDEEVNVTVFLFVLSREPSVSLENSLRNLQIAILDTHFSFGLDLLSYFLQKLKRFDQNYLSYFLRGHFSRETKLKTGNSSHNCSIICIAPFLTLTFQNFRVQCSTRK